MSSGFSVVVVVGIEKGLKKGRGGLDGIWYYVQF